MIHPMVGKQICTSMKLIFNTLSGKQRWLILFMMTCVCESLWPRSLHLEASLRMHMVNHLRDATFAGSVREIWTSPPPLTVGKWILTKLPQQNEHQHPWTKPQAWLGPIQLLFIFFSKPNPGANYSPVFFSKPNLDAKIFETTTLQKTLTPQAPLPSFCQPLPKISLMT